MLTKHSEFHKYFSRTPVAIGSLLLFVFCLSAAAFFRPLWYDEALTVLDFVTRPSILDIYRSYEIPNNQIFYTIFLRLWIEFWQHFGVISVPLLRLPSLIAACVLIACLWRFWKPRFGFWATAIVTISFIFAPSFAIYATAVRGYILSALMCLLAFELAQRQMSDFRWSRLAWYFLVVFLAIGILPSNLMFMGAVVFTVFSIHKWRNWLILASIPVLAFVIVYLPIVKKFMKVLELKEGWNLAEKAITHFYGGFIICFLPILILGLMGLFLSRGKILKKVAFWLGPLLAVSIPLLFFCFRNPSPFPRVFWNFWILFLFLIASELKKCQAWLRLRGLGSKLDSIGLASLFIMIFWGYLVVSNLDFLSRKTAPPPHQDDLFEPYFMKNFHPDRCASEVLAISKEKPIVVFLSPNADPNSIIFSGKLMNMPESFWLFDFPYRKILFDIKTLNSNLFLIVHNDSDLKMLQERFKIRQVKLHKTFGYQKIYEVLE